jgi:hypothetical protein
VVRGQPLPSNAPAAAAARAEADFDSQVSRRFRWSSEGQRATGNANGNATGIGSCTPRPPISGGHSRSDSRMDSRRRGGPVLGAGTRAHGPAWFGPSAQAGQRADPARACTRQRPAPWSGRRRFRRRSDVRCDRRARAGGDARPHKDGRPTCRMAPGRPRIGPLSGGPPMTRS